MFWLSLASPLWISLHRGVCVHDSRAHLVHLHSDMDIVSIVRQILILHITGSSRLDKRRIAAPVGPDSCYVLLLTEGELFNYIKFLPVSSS